MSKIRKCKNCLCPQFQVRYDAEFKGHQEYVECDDICEWDAYIPYTDNQF